MENYSFLSEGIEMSDGSLIMTGWMWMILGALLALLPSLILVVLLIRRVSPGLGDVKVSGSWFDPPTGEYLTGRGHLW